MKITDPLHVAHWGTYVTTPEITAAQAKVAIETTIRNHHAEGRQVIVRQTVLDKSQAVVATTESTVEVPAGGEAVATQQLTVENPARWSPESPWDWGSWPAPWDAAEASTVTCSALRARCPRQPCSWSSP